MKIMVCISQLKKGGAERVVTNLANYFINENDVTIVSLKEYEPEYKIKDNIKIVKLDSTKKVNKLKKVLNRVCSLNKTIKNEKPDIILTFLPEPSFLVLFLKKFFYKKLKVIVSVRNDPKVEYKNKIYKCIMKILYPLANGFVFQTEEARDYFDEKIKNKSTIIMNSLNPDFIVETPYKGVRKKEIVTVGRLFEQKNHKMLIKAFYKIHDKFPDYKLIIYGDGPLRLELESEIDNLGLKNKIILPGIEKDVKSKIYDAKLFVLPSLYEGMPNSLLEALSLGLPCISTDCPCGGPRTLIEDGKSGILTNVNDENMLAEKIEMLLNDERKLEELSVNAFKIKEKVDPDKINSEWIGFLEVIAKDERKY